MPARIPVDFKLLRRVSVVGDCWEWNGYRSKEGYGRISHGSPRTDAWTHRVSYELFKAPIPKGEHVLHTCDNPPCVNPAHLRTGTHAENMKDMGVKGRARRGDVDGANHRNSAFTWDEARAIRERYTAGGVTQTALAEEYGVRQATISRLLLGMTYRRNFETKDVGE